MTDGLDNSSPGHGGGKPLPRGADAMWRSLDELSMTDEFRHAVYNEFPASYMDFEANDTSRRSFLRLMGASMALAGLYGCSERPSDKILPYVRQPEQIVPGMPLFFATTMPLNGYGCGVLAQSHEGRPTKIEGNPDHPASLGATNIFMQASVLQLYDPDEVRAKNVLYQGVVSSWNKFNSELIARLDSKRKAGGKGVRVLTGTLTSPTISAQLDRLMKEFPQARWHHFDPLARTNTAQGAKIAFGKPLNTIHQFRRLDEQQKPIDAKVIVSLDSDFLWDNPGSLQYARQFAAARKVRVRHAWQTTMSRLYVIESSFSLTGSMADHRLPARPADVAAFASALAELLGIERSSGNVPLAGGKFLDAVVNELKQHRGESIVIVGESQPPEIHRLGHLINAALGNVGKTVYYTDPIERLDDHSTSASDSLRDLVNDMNAGEVDTLLILGENPAYTAPADLNFSDALYRLSNAQEKGSSGLKNFTAHLGLYFDETSYLCQWQLPETHYLEAWGDIRAFDGTASIIQPLIQPMYQGRSAIEVIDAALSKSEAPALQTGYELVRAYWQTQIKSDFESWWAKSLEKGVIADSRFKPITPPDGSGQSPVATSSPSSPSTRPSGDLEVVFRPDPSVWDGTFSNNGWLQECPKFFTKLVWDNAALVSPRTAEMLSGRYAGFADGQWLRFSSPDGLQVEAPVMVLPGLPDNVVTMHFGYGRTRGGSSTVEPDGSTPRGFNAYRFRHSRSPWTVTGVSHEGTGKVKHLVATHNHHAMNALPDFGPKDMQGDLKPEVVAHPEMDEKDLEVRNRRLVRTATLDYFNADPKHRDFVKELGGDAEKKPLLSIYPGDSWDYSKGYQWGMSIDMQSCIGCNACLVACVAENNIPVVGREEVARQREMHWIRIDQYFADDLDNPKVYNQPVPCMHCENAPCELVCPVGATVHSAEGLNQMVYNRCVGTRYCSNNCPYKVRRFNFFNYMKDGAPEFDLQHNPDVTVRSRGVMEKCTYCVQRITNTRIEIEKLIVRLEAQMKELADQLKTAPPDQQAELNRRIDSLKRERHNREFEMLERLQTACQQSCPTEAIAFGHLLPVEVVDDSGESQNRISNVRKLKEEPLNYSLLAELTTVPRTTYMARLSNPNPELEPEARS